MRCAPCGARYYSLLAARLVAAGERCEGCSGPLRLLATPAGGSVRPPALTAVSGETGPA